MPRDSSVVPIMQVDAIIEALREHLQGAAPRVLIFMPYTVLRQLLLLVLSAALTISGSNLLANLSVGGAVNYLFLVDPCSMSKLLLTEHLH